VQTAHWQPIIDTPTEVPVPRKVKVRIQVIIMRFAPLASASGLCGN
jgi:hypothetical protein